MTTWGIVSTILAPPRDVLNFVAYHLELGAHRIYILLDAENEQAFKPLKAHPKVRVQTCDEDWWKKRNRSRPKQHQTRQTANATQVYNRKSEVDWLAHIDVDEFLVSARPIAELLDQVPPATHVARVRPMELLADGDGTAFKGYIAPGPTREKIVDQLFPTYGRYLRAGFLSHVGGKIFVRTGQPDITLRIHKAFSGDEELRPAFELTQADLAHCHAKSWDEWYVRFGYRLEHGAYRARLDPTRTGKPGAMSLNELFNFLQNEGGIESLRAFHDEVAADSPFLRGKLEEHGLLRIVDLDLNSAFKKHFPDEV